MDHPQLNMAGVEFHSEDRADFIKDMEDGRSDTPLSYLSDDFMKGLETAAGDENWNLFTFTWYDGKPGYFGQIGYIYNYLLRWNAKTQKVDFMVFGGFLPIFDSGMLYSFEGVATISSPGQIYGDIELLKGNYKPLGIAVEDQKSWFDIMQLLTMHSLDATLNPKKSPSAPAPPAKFLRKAMRAEE